MLDTERHIKISGLVAGLGVRPRAVEQHFVLGKAAWGIHRGFWTAETSPVETDTTPTLCRAHLPRLQGLWVTPSRCGGDRQQCLAPQHRWNQGMSVVCWLWLGQDWWLELHQQGEGRRFPSSRIPPTRLYYCSTVWGRMGESLSHCLAESNCSSDYVKKWIFLLKIHNPKRKLLCTCFSALCKPHTTGSCVNQDSRFGQG